MRAPGIGGKGGFTWPTARALARRPLGMMEITHRKVLCYNGVNRAGAGGDCILPGRVRNRSRCVGARSDIGGGGGRRGGVPATGGRLQGFLPAGNGHDLGAACCSMRRHPACNDLGTLRCPAQGEM